MATTDEHKLIDKLLEQLIIEEQEGKEFYIEASKIVKDKALIQLFEWLSIEELTHIDYLENLKKIYTQKNTLSDADWEQKQRILVYAGKKISVLNIETIDLQDVALPQIDIFNTHRFKEFIQANSVETVLKTAMKLEYNSFYLLKKILARFETKSLRELITQLMLQEKTHYEAIERKLKRIT